MYAETLPDLCGNLKQGSSKTQYYPFFALKYFQASLFVFDSHKFINKTTEKIFFMDICVTFFGGKAEGKI